MPAVEATCELGFFSIILNGFLLKPVNFYQLQFS